MIVSDLEIAIASPSFASFFKKHPLKCDTRFVNDQDRDDIKKLEDISKKRGTNLQVLLKSYNIGYNDKVQDEDNSE